MTTGRGRGEALEERAPGAEQLLGADAGPDAEERQQRGLDPAALVGVGDVRREGRRRPSPGSSSRRRSRAGRQRPRTISPRAQKLMPSPYAGERPSCHQTVSTRPSTYLRNSQARRLLPIPAGPDDRDEARPPLPARRVEEVLEQAELVVATDERRLEASRSGCGRRPPRRRGGPARPATGAVLPLSACSPAGSKAIARLAARCVASPTRTVPGGATDWSRLAVFTRSPATIPWSVAPIVTAASPVRTPARASMPGPSDAHGVDQLERRPDGTLGVVLVGDRCAPDGHDRVADELLDACRRTGR